MSKTSWTPNSGQGSYTHGHCLSAFGESDRDFAPNPTQLTWQRFPDRPLASIQPGSSRYQVAAPQECAIGGMPIAPDLPEFMQTRGGIHQILTHSASREAPSARFGTLYYS